MPTGIAAPPWRRAIVLIAAWLVVLQAFLSGVATAQAGALIAADPLAAAVICHGGGGAGGDPAAPAVPDADAVWHFCCTYCTAAAPALPPVSANIAPATVNAGAALPILVGFTIILARAAVRAGPSQAPPRRA